MGAAVGGSVEVKLISVGEIAFQITMCVVLHRNYVVRMCQIRHACIVCLPSSHSDG